MFGLHEHIQSFIISKSFLQIKYKMSSFKSSENIQKKEGGPDRPVSNSALIDFFLLICFCFTLDSIL